MPFNSKFCDQTYTICPFHYAVSRSLSRLLYELWHSVPLEVASPALLTVSEERHA